MKAIACGLKDDAGSIVAGKDQLRRGKTHDGTATGLFFKEWSYGFHGLVVLDESLGKASLPSATHRLARMARPDVFNAARGCFYFLETLRSSR
jgi:hypothetical protein